MKVVLFHRDEANPQTLEASRRLAAALNCSVQKMVHKLTHHDMVVNLTPEWHARLLKQRRYGVPRKIVLLVIGDLGLYPPPDLIYSLLSLEEGTTALAHVTDAGVASLKNFALKHLNYPVAKRIESKIVRFDSIYAGFKGVL